MKNLLTILILTFIISCEKDTAIAPIEEEEIENSVSFKDFDGSELVFDGKVKVWCDADVVCQWSFNFSDNYQGISSDYTYIVEWLPVDESIQYSLGFLASARDNLNRNRLLVPGLSANTSTKVISMGRQPGEYVEFHFSNIIIHDDIRNIEWSTDIILKGIIAD